LRAAAQAVARVYLLKEFLEFAGTGIVKMASVLLNGARLPSVV
jgi:hypothetical protein